MEQQRAGSLHGARGTAQPSRADVGRGALNALEQPQQSWDPWASGHHLTSVSAALRSLCLPSAGTFSLVLTKQGAQWGTVLDGLLSLFAHHQV